MEELEREDLKERLFLNKKNGWLERTDEEKNDIFKFADEYIYYLNKGKTEKEIKGEKVQGNLVNTYIFYDKKNG